MLSSLLAVFIGGGVGSVLRWAVSMKMNPLNAHIPLGTLMVNLIGGFIIGLALSLIHIQMCIRDRRYVSPAEFDEMKEEAMAMGFTHAACGPFVRSSYHADLQAKGMEVK